MALALTAQAVEINRVGANLILRDASCSRVNSIAQSLAQWTHSMETRNNCPAVLPRGQLVGRACQLDITSCVPAHVQRYQGNRIEAGPNCWNLALVLRGILPNIRMASPEEMTFYMNPPLCRALRDGEGKRPGDVVAIRKFSDADLVEVHGFIYISPEIAYSKNGMEAEVPYSLQSLESVYQAYNVPNTAQCRANQANLSANCEAETSVYRCSSMGNYLNQHPNIPEELTTALRDFGIFDRCLEALYVDGTSISRTAQNNLEDSTRALTFYLQQNHQSASEEQTFILGSLQLRLAAIVENLPYDQSTAELRTLRAAFDRSLGELNSSR